MPSMTIKARSGGPATWSELVAVANKKALSLVERARERVLVVYGKGAASIYYEGIPPKGAGKLS